MYASRLPKGRELLNIKGPVSNNADGVTIDEDGTSTHLKR